MAIPSGSGTEVLKNIMYEDVSASSDPSLTLVQNHIYTILSVNIYNAHASNVGHAQMFLWGYDSYGSANGQYIGLFKAKSVAGEDTFVFNDKVVVYGQGSNSAAQKIIFIVSGSTFDITMSYIDQDWT